MIEKLNNKKRGNHHSVTTLKRKTKKIQFEAVGKTFGVVSREPVVMLA